MFKKPNISSTHSRELRRLAENRLGRRSVGNDSKSKGQISQAEALQLLHELEVHQIELEMQNAELQVAREELEVALEKSTDLYDFAPVGYFSLDESGVILEANLTSAALLGVERSRLVNARLPSFISSTSQPGFQLFLKKVFTAPTGQICDALMFKRGGGSFWAHFRGTSANAPKGARKWCRVSFADITSQKEGEEAQRRMEALALANKELKCEIVRREKVEAALRRSERHYSQLLGESRQMQHQLRQLSRRILSVQEEERKEISRELHDVIAQSLAGINVHLTALVRHPATKTKGLARNIARTQRIVAKSVESIHRFARELRPAVLDDLGLIPALEALLKTFNRTTGVRASLTAFAKVEQLDAPRRTALFRVVQEALTNVAQHAKASRVAVTIEKAGSRVCMRIEDDGRSFDLEGALDIKKNKRLGLVGMRERIEMVGGTFSVKTHRDKGTTVVVNIPMAVAVRSAAR